MKKPINFRIDETLKDIVFRICKETGLKPTEFYELATIDFIIKFNGDLVLEGIDLKEYAQFCKSEKLRRIASKERNEFLSKNLMSARINLDIYKMIKTQKSKIPFAKLKVLIMEYLQIREKEANHYRNNETILGEITNIKLLLDKQMSDIVQYIEGNFNDIDFMKKVLENKKK